MLLLAAQPLPGWSATRKHPKTAFEEVIESNRRGTRTIKALIGNWLSIPRLRSGEARSYARWWWADCRDWTSRFVL